MVQPPCSRAEDHPQKLTYVKPQARQMTSKQQSIKAINDWYDRRMYTSIAKRFYGEGDFHNYGYWQHGTATLEQACENSS